MKTKILYVFTLLMVTNIAAAETPKISDVMGLAWSAGFCDGLIMIKTIQSTSPNTAEAEIIEKFINQGVSKDSPTLKEYIENCPNIDRQYFNALEQLKASGR